MQSAPLTDLLHQSLGRDVLAAATPPSLARLPMAIGVETSLIKSSPRRMHPLLTTNVSRSATKNGGSTSGCAIAGGLANGLFRRCGGHRHPRSLPPQMRPSAIRPGGLDG